MTNYSDYNTESVQEALKNKPLFLPVGAIEQHGPHLPLSVDIDIATAIATELAHRTQGMLAPGIPYAARSLPHSGGGASFPGTIAIRGDILIGYLVDIIKSFLHAGTRRLIIVNGHYENEPFLFEALEVCRESNLFESVDILCLSWWNAVKSTMIDALFGDEFPGWHAEHASKIETSLMLYIKPDKVKPLRIDHTTPPLAGVYQYPIPASLSHRGVLAKTTGSSADIGEKLFHHICDEMLTILHSGFGR